jgi:hypothetical protein
MTFKVIRQPNGGARSPFHIVETQSGREVEWVNRFLDRECTRCLAETTLRSYAMDLLHFLRWWADIHQTDAITENALPSVLPDYIRFQAGQHPRPAPATINRRVIVVGCAWRNQFPDTACTAAPYATSRPLRLSTQSQKPTPARTARRAMRMLAQKMPLSTPRAWPRAPRAPHGNNTEAALRVRPE